MKKNILGWSASFGVIFLLFGFISVSSVSSGNREGKRLIKITDCSQSKTQAMMDSCRSKSYEASKLKLSVTFKKVSNSYVVNEPKLESFLIAAQQKWAEFVVVECEFNSYYSRGSVGYNGYLIGCLELKTLKRIQALEYILKTP